MSATPVVDRARVEVKRGPYEVASATSLTDPAVLPQVQDYRRQASSRMYPIGREDIGQKIPTADYHVSRKIDGEFTVLVYRHGEVFSINPGGTVRLGLPWQSEAARLLEQAQVTEAMIAGELYTRHEQGRRARVHDIVSLARHPQSDADLDRIGFAVFDVISLNEQSFAGRDFSETWTSITNTFASGKLVHPVESRVASTVEQIQSLFAKWVEDEGAEGLVVRSDNGGNFKIKPRHSLDAVVVGFTESSGDRQGLLHDMLLAVMRSDGTFHVLCRVGGGLSEDDRRNLLSDLKDRVVDSEYAEVNSDRVAYQMVRPEWVVEINCLDLVAETTRGGPVNRMVLEYDANPDAGFRVIRRMPLAAVISPQFVRRREDKEPVPQDVSIDQIGQRVDLPLAAQDARQLTLPASELLQREVYVKQLKGQTMVRKFVLWKTNKEQQTEEFPGYVLHYTDFSPNRKDPLSRDLRVSNSREQIESLWNQLKKAHIKSGWTLAEQVESPHVPLESSTDEPTERKMAASARETTTKPARKKSS